ncbi:MAG: protein kinase, partial [Planctomycetes bacterium]|nr:protein kinase [Planctomycetota bacterium]
RLGSGGMGKVYRAREAATGRPVALKVVRPALIENPTVRGRYAREVQTASQLSHPNIVGVFDAGEANGRVYMAMEFVDGPDLARLIRDFEVFAVPEACEYARQVALGLEHAHASGFVHRDVKPSNVVVAGERHVPQATEPAVVKLLDLGLSRALDPFDMVAPDLTRDHTVVGTPDYMAPEQARDSKTVDPRADVYSLGCTLYFLLTGRVPFPAKGAIEKILAHQSEHPPPLQALRPDVPAAVAELVARMMAKRPENRFQTAGEVAAALEPHARYPEGAPPVEMVPRPRGEQARGAPADTGVSRSTFPSSVGPLEFIGLSRDEAPVPVEPTDRPADPASPTPRPRPQKSKPKPSRGGAAKEKGAAAPRKYRGAARKARRREIPAVVWVVLALCGFVVLAVTYWLLTGR